MTQKTRSQGNKPPNKRRVEIPPGWQDPLRQQQPLVSSRWLLRAFAVSLGIALVCAYLTLCVLFYQGSWQLLFHPSSAVPETPANVGLSYDEIRFSYTEMGQPQLTGWWIPADPGARYSDRTVLYLHGATGSLSDTLTTLTQLHRLGINIFAFDYRGFGHSMPLHPSEQSVYQDAEDAVAYLSDTRKLAPRNIVLYGEGLGATIAADAALHHPQVLALILDTPTAPALEQIATDPRTSLLPVRLLSRDRFELAPKLRNLKTPKLLLAPRADAKDLNLTRRMQSLFTEASPPKTLVPVASREDAPTVPTPAYFDSLRQFLDENIAAQPARATGQAVTP